jgi:hypothetical protein
MLSTVHAHLRLDGDGAAGSVVPRRMIPAPLLKPVSPAGRVPQSPRPRGSESARVDARERGRRAAHTRTARVHCRFNSGPVSRSR